MEARSNWYNRIVKEIEVYQTALTKKEFKKYKLDFLLRIVGRVEEFSGTCGECQLFQQEIGELVQELSLLIQMPGKESRRSHIKRINKVARHLQKGHKLVSSGYYIGICMAIGTGIGAALGIALDNPGIGPTLGIGIGLAIGSYLDRKAKREGRVL